MSEPIRCETEIEVRYAETDQMGVVHHANYVVWFELARTRLCALSGFHYAAIEAMGYFLMVTGVEARYRKPARYGDTVQVACWGERLASRGLRFAYEVRRGEELLATGATDHIWVERVDRPPLPRPRGGARPLQAPGGAPRRRLSLWLRPLRPAPRRCKSVTPPPPAPPTLPPSLGLAAPHRRCAPFPDLKLSSSK